jgi:hypothetical protein
MRARLANYSSGRKRRGRPWAHRREARGQLQHGRRRTVILGESITTMVVHGSENTAGRGAGVEVEQLGVAENKVASVFRWKASAGAAREKPSLLE